jgi:hypothetical protein
MMLVKLLPVFNNPVIHPVVVVAPKVHCEELVLKFEHDIPPDTTNPPDDEIPKDVPTGYNDIFVLPKYSSVHDSDIGYLVH